MIAPGSLQAKLLDWIRECLAADEPTPTDQEICDRYCLLDVAKARAVMADLAERGAITIKGYGPERVVTLGREAPRLPNARPEPLITKPDRAVDRLAAKIVSISKREGAPVEVASPAAIERPSSGFIGTDAELTGLIGTLVAELASRAGQSSEVANLRRELDEMTARAEAAEAKLAQARQALAA